jgi:hypothetical protein
MVVTIMAIENPKQIDCNINAYELQTKKTKEERLNYLQKQMNLKTLDDQLEKVSKKVDELIGKLKKEKDLSQKNIMSFEIEKFQLIYSKLTQKKINLTQEETEQKLFKRIKGSYRSETKDYNDEEKKIVLGLINSV